MNKEYRHGLVNAQIEVDLSLQIRALRKQLVGTQPDLSNLTGMKQPRISAMEKPGGAHFTLETLRRLAEAFDVALIVRFAPFSELLDWSGRFNPDTFRVPNFAAEVEAAKLPEPKATWDSFFSKCLSSAAHQKGGNVAVLNPHWQTPTQAILFQSKNGSLQQMAGAGYVETQAVSASAAVGSEGSKFAQGTPAEAATDPRLKKYKSQESSMPTYIATWKSKHRRNKREPQPQNRRARHAG